MPGAGGVCPGLHGIAMEDETVDSFAEGPIAQVLDQGRVPEPPFAVGSSERLRTEDRLAVDMGRGGHFCAAIGRAELGPRPELGHRLVGLTGVGHLVARHAIVGLDRKPQALAVGQGADMSGVVLDEHVGNRLPQVPEEPLGDLQTIDHAAGEYRQQGQQIVASPPLELLAHERRPVLRANLPTIDVRRDQDFALAGQRSVLVNETAHQGVEMHFCGGLAELIAFQAAARLRGRVVVHIGCSVPEPHNEPFAWGHLPGETAASIHLAGEVDDADAVDDRPCRCRGESGPLRRKMLRRDRRLTLDAREAKRALGIRHGQHGDIAVEVPDRLRLGQGLAEVFGAGDARLRPDDALHR